MREESECAHSVSTSVPYLVGHVDQRCLISPFLREPLFSRYGFRDVCDVNGETRNRRVFQYWGHVSLRCSVVHVVL